MKTNKCSGVHTQDNFDLCISLKCSCHVQQRKFNGRDILLAAGIPRNIHNVPVVSVLATFNDEGSTEWTY
jgi:hypothetical protein